jgi:hypothetical protein
MKSSLIIFVTIPSPPFAQSTKDSSIGIVFSVSSATSNKKRIGNRCRAEREEESPETRAREFTAAGRQSVRERHETDWTRRPSSHRFYIQVQSSPIPDGGDTSKDLLEEIYKPIQNCVSKPARRGLSELVTSSIG